MQFVKAVYIDNYLELVGCTVIDTNSVVHEIKDFKDGVFLGISEITEHPSLININEILKMQVIHASGRYSIALGSPHSSKDEDAEDDEYDEWECPCGCGETYKDRS